MGERAADSPLGHNSIRAEVVTTYEQLLHAYAIRAICFMEEHGVKATQTYDGNDYQATHLILCADEEPIGTARIRWFKDFAKFERSSIRPAYRNVHVIKACAEFAFDHAARKGYDKIITHAKPKYARMWRTLLGFKNAEGKAPVYFAGHDEPYIELVKYLSPPENAISIDTDATILFRTEGYWDTPSRFEAAEL
jgi:Acetyltransferase (GNAT) family